MSISKSTIRKIAAFTLGLSVVAGANATDESFDANIVLIAPIVITEVEDLDFAQTTAGTLSTVTTAPASARPILTIC